ncbi:energy-coupling factor transporter transmembrane protein BioN [Rhodoferax lithotrophicus]|uniref:Energy-coupling factor transporter transmembrane protein BioN n=1 Tax=Rhodoferax lithotrophicus TaxID=2798804 RepID=A0ABN6D6U7_9BURK|nr:energy-coupling factor transporter transmembrane protein EcfT [Rhodoferax sp. MIZ03]BCO27731.1 energy-coupling factor transporter transmembrane protein BioN [Rhodoferax sp. MIZ03]
MGSLYSEHQTWLHRVPAAIKLIFFAVLGSVQFLLDSSNVLMVSALACSLLFASLGRATYPAFKLVRAVLLAGLLIMVFHAYMHQPVLGMVSALRLFSASLLGIALTLTTRSRDLLSVFESLLSPLQRVGIKTERLALQLAMMLRFTEHFFVVWKRLDDAHRIRTGKAGGLTILAPLTIKMLVSARRVADTLELRLGE